MPKCEPRRIPLASLPTPLVQLRNLSAKYDQAQIWIKRDDLSGLELSGNKVRKLEYVVADVIDGGADTIVTEGTPQSNHCRATAAVCARAGLHAHLLFRPAPTGPPQGNHLLDELFGAESESFTRETFSADHDPIVARTLARLRDAGRTPRFTPMGASEPVGCWGYIRAAAELAEQVKGAGIDACDLVVALSSGGTYAGLLLGKLLFRLEHFRIWAVPVSDDVPYHTREVGNLCRRTIDAFDLPLTFDDAALDLLDGYVGEGYGIPYARALDAQRELARTEAILLDAVYTAKAFCALLDGLRDGRFGRKRPVIFVHTGGVFSNFAWPELLAPSAHGA